MIHVIATVTVTEGKRDAFLNEFRQLMPLVLEEQGCLAYAPAIDSDPPLQAQQLAGPNRVVILEQWSSVPDLQRHLAAPHMVEYRERVKELVEDVAIQVLQPV